MKFLIFLKEKRKEIRRGENLFFLFFGKFFLNFFEFFFEEFGEFFKMNGESVVQRMRRPLHPAFMQVHRVGSQDS